MNDMLNQSSLYEGIKHGGVKRQKAIAEIYRDKKLKNQIVAYVNKNSGNREEGIDIFHEGIIALDDNIRKNKFRGDGNLNAYLYSICKFLWLNKLKRNKRMVYTENENELDQVQHDTPETLSLADEQKTIINTLLDRIGEKCKKILELWKLSYSMEEIAQHAGLGNAGIARRQRYNCYQKLLKIIDEESGLRNILKTN